MRVSIWDELSQTYQPTDIPEEIWEKTSLKEMMSFSFSDIPEEESQILELPKEKITLQILKRILFRKDEFVLLVREFEALDFLGLSSAETLKRIGNDPFFDPSLLGYSANHVVPYLNKKNFFSYIDFYGVGDIREDLRSVLRNISVLNDYDQYGFERAAKTLNISYSCRYFLESICRFYRPLVFTGSGVKFTEVIENLLRSFTAKIYTGNYITISGNEYIAELLTAFFREDTSVKYFDEPVINKMFSWNRTVFSDTHTGETAREKIYNSFDDEELSRDHIIAILNNFSYKNKNPSKPFVEVSPKKFAGRFDVY